MKKGITLKLFVIGLSAAALVTGPVQAYAWGGHGRGHDVRHYPHYGRTSWWLPAAFATLVIAGATYYYCEGVYYRRHGATYVVVEPPAGAVVTTIPAGYQPVLVNGVTYYTHDGIYYQYTPSGFVVVPQPAVVAVPQSAVVVDPQPQVQVTADTFTVNIPNTKGGYTPVQIKRQGTGYVGPQGEYYPAFPSVDQLKAMYGNS